MSRTQNSTPQPPDETPGPAMAGSFGLGSMGEQSVQSIAAQRQQSIDAVNAADGKGYVVNPNGTVVPIETYLEHLYVASDHSSIFADPARFMKEPKKDCMYVWASKGDPKMFGRIRSHRYRPVTADELRDDTDLPIETHTVSGDTKFVACYDVVLMEVPPQAVKELFKAREAQAAMRTATHVPFQNLKQQIESDSHGLATAEASFKVGQ